jgi:hypothetical protein
VTVSCSPPAAVLIPQPIRFLLSSLVLSGSRELKKKKVGGISGFDFS